MQWRWKEYMTRDKESLYLDLSLLPPHSLITIFMESVHLSIILLEYNYVNPVYLSVCVCVCPSLCLYDCLSVCFSPCLPVCLSACFSLCLPTASLTHDHIHYQLHSASLSYSTEKIFGLQKIIKKFNISHKNKKNQILRDQEFSINSNNIIKQKLRSIM